jgi:hypothetical protein
MHHTPHCTTRIVYPLEDGIFLEGMVSRYLGMYLYVYLRHSSQNTMNGWPSLDPEAVGILQWSHAHHIAMSCCGECFPHFPQFTPQRSRILGAVKC